MDTRHDAQVTAPVPQRRGRWRRGCLVVLVTVMVFAAAGLAGLAWLLCRKSEPPPAAGQLPPSAVAAPDASALSLEEKMRRFYAAVPGPLVFHAADLNAFLQTVPRLAELRDQLQLSIVNGLVILDGTFPTEELGFGQWELQGKIWLRLAFSDGQAELYIEALNLAGYQMPDFVQQRLAAIDLAERLRRHEDPLVREALADLERRVEKLEVRGDQIVVWPQPASPAPASAPQ